MEEAEEKIQEAQRETAQKDWAPRIHPPHHSHSTRL